MAKILIFLKKIQWLLAVVLIGLAGVVVGTLGFSLILANDLYDYQDTMDGVHLPEVDAIVCLAGGRGRIAGAGDVWYRYREDAQDKGPDARAPILFLSGMGRQTTWNAVAKNFRAGVLAEIKPEDVVVENESENTEANARWFLQHAKARNWQRILLVTSPYHMKRARYIFERIGLKEGRQLGIDTLSIFQEPFEAAEWRQSFHGIRVTLTEYYKWVYYRYFWTY